MFPVTCSYTVRELPFELEVERMLLPLLRREQRRDVRAEALPDGGSRLVDDGPDRGEPQQVRLRDRLHCPASRKKAESSNYLRVA